MATKTRRRFTQDEKAKYVTEYEAAVSRRKGQEWLDASDGISASHIASFRRSLEGKKASAKNSAPSTDRVNARSGAPAVSMTSSAGMTSERLRVGLELAVAELGGSITWDRKRA